LSYKTISKLLRDSLNFSGVVISDELFMNAISANYTLEEAASCNL
jgi:beta-glucosidase-like glycosyl hydrolase